MSGCGAKCGCGSSCSCGSGCNGCGKYPDLNVSETTTTKTIVAGVPPVKMHHEESEMSSGAENGCKCGDNCTCNPCNCK